MKSQVKRAGVAAMVLTGSMMASGVASAGDRDDLMGGTTVVKGDDSVSFTYELTKDGGVVTHQTIDGIDFTFAWEGVTWPDAPIEDGATAKGIIGTLWDMAVKAVKDGLAGGGKDGGGSGGGTTNSCTVNINVTGGAQSVNVGNINCGGTQGSGNGTGSGPA